MDTPARTAQLSSEQLTGIIDTAMDAVITVDVRQRVVLVNRAACEVFRVSTEEALGQPLDRFLPARLQQAHRAHVQHYSQHGQTVRHMGRLHRLVGARADGSEFPLEASLSRLGTGDAVLMTVVLRDITERLELERSHEARLAAEAASLAKSLCLATMSHELRTPLSAILGFAQLLQMRRNPPLDSAASEQVDRIRAAGEQLLSLVDDLLDLSRLEANAVHIECRHVTIAPAIEEAWSLVSRQADAAALRFDAAHLAETHLAAWCDPRRLRQVLSNLLSNAVKYNRPGGAVRVELGSGADEVRVVVEDTGVGMTAEQLAHLYEPFNRLGQAHGSIQGHGIGLTLTRQLVERMHGQLHIDSQPGRGTRALLRLPARPPVVA